VVSNGPTDRGIADRSAHRVRGNEAECTAASTRVKRLHSCGGGPPALAPARPRAHAGAASVTCESEGAAMAITRGSGSRSV